MKTASHQRQFIALDAFRIIATLLVVAIHTSPLASFSPTADFVLTRVFARIAVPFFFMVTGFFLLPPYLFGHTKDYRRLSAFLKKTLILYLAAVLLYLPVNLYAGHFRDTTLWDKLRMLLFDGTFYHLWYLPALILGMLLVCLLGRRLPFKAVMSFCLMLYLFGLLGDSYYGITAAVPGMKSIYDAMFLIFSYTRNGIFYAPVFLVMGAYLSQGRQKEQKCNKTLNPLNLSIQQNVVDFSIFLIIMIAEGLLLHRFDMQRHDSMYIALLPCMLFLFRVILAIEQKNRISERRAGLFPAGYLRTLSTYIYLLHPLCIILLRGFAKVVHLEAILIDNSLIHYIVVCVLSCMASFGITTGGASAFASLTVSTIPHILQKNQSYFKNRAWIEIDLGHLSHNVSTLQNLLPPGCELMPAVKANAYGHGAVLISKALYGMGVKNFCVASVSEGIELRRGGIKGEILVLGYTYEKDFPLLRKYRLTQTVVDHEYAKILNDYGKKLRVHLKIDTGMHRLGERCEQFEKICHIFKLKNLVIEGIYTHLCADESTSPSDKAFTLAQAQALYDITSKLRSSGFPCPKIHLLASYGLINYPELSGDYARVGIALYGVLSTRPAPEDQTGNRTPNLMPILSVKARVAVVKTLLQGESAGYGMQYIAGQDAKIGVITIGYADGFPRALSHGRGSVLINGHKAPIIGNICMDQTIVDITDIPDVKAGDIAVIIGQSGELEITAYDLAEQTDSITNEVLSRLGARLERIII
ncbi:MAG: serine racemase VanT catalytic subunit [Bacteroidales bacterium]|nr:serine racemase VanT catalytic subunit [Lachnoclostridium sp.]MCM1384316.1 serine racemase VanT catalytic subunit [Lachnoclostridium sp.]MCM1464897.1 serine racemase VanT catalytic subunit [Bacteroidales bacterium]